MMRRERDEDAVSAAIATVLLFAGVLSIISGMLVAIVPVIDEMHGAVEREAMAGQMSDMAIETERLSESGIPGDVAEMTIRPHTGNLEWDLLKGGSWFSATHQENSMFRLEGVLDLDNEMRFRHGEHLVETICSTDLHASVESAHHYRIPTFDGATVTAAPLHTLTSTLGTQGITLENGDIATTSISSDGIWSYNQGWDSSEDVWLHSPNPLQVILWRGEGGAFIAEPDQTTPGTDEGRTWTVPLIAGTHGLHIISDDPFTLGWEMNSGSGSGVSNSISLSQFPDGEDSTGHVWNGEVTANAVERLTVHTSSDARLVVHSGESANLDGDGPGAIPWPDRGGAWTGTHFLPPAMDGSLILHNPNTASTTVSIGGLYHSIGGLTSLRIQWSALNPSWVQSADSISVEWVLDDQTVGNSATHSIGWRPGSLSLMPATDTARSTGQSWTFEAPTNGGSSTSPTVGDVKFILQPAAPTASWSTGADMSDPLNESNGYLPHSDAQRTLTLASTHTGTFPLDATNGPIRTWVAAGADGATPVVEDGFDRCVNVDMRATGWISANLPWTPVSNWNEMDVRNAWQDGTHFFGLEMTIRGNVGDESHTTLGTAWALHLPRLSYTFDSSVADLEIITQGGFVGTNHPEYRPDVLVEPTSREGPGPRLAVTIPVILPTIDSIGGSTELSLELSLESRDQLSSMTAYQIRRGWDGPYAIAIATEATTEAELSADWIAFPGQLDMLNDFVGWVQTTPSMPEVVYHSGGEPVLFNIQVAGLSSHTSRGEMT
ncbi:MAG: hypothetical protein QGF94_00165 [Candidatus Thalassarchaeaceae archaeon]|jgi:hypothetical protein|nr:hypothetical protein [Candidatus Thalassarchaeaceae archaeon]